MSTAVAMLFGVSVYANPSFYPVITYLDGLTSATTTPKYLTPGTATSTMVVNSYANNSSNTKFDAGYLAIQYTGSSSAAVIDYTVEFSMDGIDYFGEDVLPDTTSLNQSTFNHSSTTPTHRWGAGSATASTTRKMIEQKVPFRYQKYTFSVPIGVTNGALWTQFVPVKQTSE